MKRHLEIMLVTLLLFMMFASISKSEEVPGSSLGRRKLVVNELPDRWSVNWTADEKAAFIKALPAREEHNRPKYFLTVCVLIRNEARSILEVVRHYIEEGVDHVYILNDRSTDKFRERLSCVPRERYSVWNLAMATDYGGHDLPDQHDVLTAMIPTWRSETEWVIVVDADEFVASRSHPSLTIQEVLRLPILSKCDEVIMPWIRFVWGNLTTTPSNIRTSHLWRFGYGEQFSKEPLEVRLGMKAVWRPRMAERAMQHHVQKFVKGAVPCKPCPFVFLSEGDIDRCPLATFHYQIQSWQHLREKQDNRSIIRASRYNHLVGRKAHLVNQAEVYDTYMTRRSALRAHNTIHQAAQRVLRTCPPEATSPSPLPKQAGREPEPWELVHLQRSRKPRQQRPQ